MRLKLLLLCFYFLNFSFLDAAILCLDFGGTRIKGAVINEELQYEDLKTINTFVIPTDDWLSPRFLDFFGEKSPLPFELLTSASKWAIAIRGPVYEHSRYLFKPRGLPYYIKDSIESVVNKPVILENDAISFCYGAIALKHLEGEKIEYPMLSITLGTGVGLVIALSSDDLIGYEMYNTPEFQYEKYAKEYKKILGITPTLWKVQGPLGFHMLKNFPKEWDENKVCEMYRTLFRAFMSDIQKYFTSIGIPLKTVVVGQGNSRFLQLEDLDLEGTTGQYLFNSQEMQKKGLSSDLLSLLGAWAILTWNLPAAEQSPAFASVYDIE